MLKLNQIACVADTNNAAINDAFAFPLEMHYLYRALSAECYLPTQHQLRAGRYTYVRGNLKTD